MIKPCKDRGTLNLHFYVKEANLIRQYSKPTFSMNLLHAVLINHVQNIINQKLQRYFKTKMFKFSHAYSAALWMQSSSQSIPP
jgi:hypothetical protein